MSRGFMIVSDGCPMCAWVTLVINEYNLLADPEDWIEILDKDSFDIRIDYLKEMLNSPSAPTPIGIIDDAMINYFREYNHLKTILKNSLFKVSKKILRRG